MDVSTRGWWDKGDLRGRIHRAHPGSRQASGFRSTGRESSGGYDGSASSADGRQRRNNCVSRRDIKVVERNLVMIIISPISYNER